MKKLFTLFLLLVASVGTMFAWDYERVPIGNLYYNLDATNQTAEVTSQNSSNPYWSTTITTAIIPASVEYNSVTYSVTRIGNLAFYDYTGLTSVTIPNSVTSIGYYAFQGCTGLTSVTIPNSVKSIGSYAFSGCTGLTSVTIPNSVTSISNAFSHCSGLTSMSVEEGNAVYDSRDNCNAIIETASNTLVAGCQNTIIPNSVTSIGSEAFRGCTGLTSVTIPNSVTSIGDWAFYNCTGLTSVHISDIATWCAFSFGNSKANPLCYAHNLYLNDELITNLVIPNNVTSIGEGVLSYCSGLTAINVNADNPNYSSLDGVLFNKDKTTLIQYPGGKQGGYTIPNSVTQIGSAAFGGCSGLTSVTIPNSVTSLEYRAFYGCSGLTSIEIPNSVTSIGNSAFNECSGLTSITIPNSVTSIGDWAFERCTGLTSVTIPNSVTNIGERAFNGCTGLTSITCEATTPPTLGSSVFMDVDKSIPLYVPAQSVDLYKAVDGWSEFTNIQAINPDDCVLPPTVSSCYQMSDMTTSSSEVPISTVTYSFCYQQAEVQGNFNYLYLCGNTTAVDGYTVCGLEQLDEQSWTFYQYSNNLKCYLIPSDQYSQIEYIYSNEQHSVGDIIEGKTIVAISGECIKSYTPSANSVGSQYDVYFYYKADGSVVYVTSPLLDPINSYPPEFQRRKSSQPANTYLYKYAVMSTSAPCQPISGTCGAQGDNLTWELSCDGVLTISGTGAMADWNGIATPWEDYKQQITTVILPDGITKIGLAAFKNCTNLTAINIPEGVAGIESNTFSGCTSLNNIVLPQSVSFIRSYAFYNCTGLTAINIPDNVTTIGNHAFRNCTALTDIAIPDKVTSIGIWAFHSCSALTNLTLGSGLTDIQEKAFYNCTNLTAVTIPATVTTIGDYAFYGCSSLASLTIDNSAAEIGKGAFYECAAMTTAVLGNRLTGIGVEAFYGCATLLAVDIPATVTALGDYAFRNCPAMTSATFRTVTPPAIGNAAFFETPCTFYVPCGSKDTYKEALSVSADRVEETIIPFVYSVTSSDETQGTVTLTQEPVSCDDLTLAFRADANNGYQFVQWSDGNTDNPRTVVLTQDITLTAVFELDQCILGSGTCGENLTWELSCDGVLSISGTGGMADFAKETAPWNANRDAINSVSIENGVTSIGRFAFYECVNMASVAIPEGVTSIGDSAFYHCAALANLVLPNTLTTIGYRAFRDCFALTSVTIPESVTSLGCGGTFQRCNALTTVNWNARNSEILPNADESYSPPFYSSEGGLPGITSFNFGENVERIPATLCYGMSGLTSITFPDGLKRIDNSAFSECAGITSITIPANVEKTGNSVFNACTSLKEVTMLPETAPTFGSYIFSNISSNFSVIVPCGTMDAYKSALSYYASKIKYLPLEFSVSGLVNDAVAGSVTVPANRCENMFTAVANEGYEFVRWADGETANPRMVVLTQDTVLTAVFESTAIPQNDTTFIHDGENPDIEDIPGNDPNIVVEPGGELNVNWWDIRLGVITIITAGGQSGQIHNAENLANWRFFMEYKLNPLGSTASPNLWYAFAVPFEVDIENGITRAYGKKSHVSGVDFQILEYDGMLRAQTGKGWVKKNTGSLEPGTFYMIGIEGNCNRWLFEKKSDAAIQGDSHVNLSHYSAGNSDNGKHNGWNGKGNSRLEYSEMDLTGIADFLYLYNNEFGKFELTAAAGIELCVGQPFFIQANADASFDFFHNGGTHPMPALRAPQTAKPQMHFTLTSNRMHVGTDHMYVTMHEDATTTYTIGRDVARMSMNCKTAAQLWCLSADGTELAAHDIALPETETVIPIGLFAPKNGEYLLNMSERATDDFEVELLYNGTYAATLFADQPLALTLNAGTTTDYSIRVRRRMPTEIDQVPSDQVQCTKVLIDNHLYILKGAQIFDAQGKLVK